MSYVQRRGKKEKEYIEGSHFSILSFFVIYTQNKVDILVTTVFVFCTDDSSCFFRSCFFESKYKVVVNALRQRKQKKEKKPEKEKKEQK